MGDPGMPEKGQVREQHQGTYASCPCYELQWSAEPTEHEFQKNDTFIEATGEKHKKWHG